MSHETHYVLIVDDEPLVRIGASTLFAEAGYRVFEAANAAQAISVLKHHSEIGLIFTDIDMPGPMDGMALARFARDRYPPIQIIVASGQPHPEGLELPAGALFLPKPYQDETVLAAAAALDA